MLATDITKLGKTNHENLFEERNLLAFSQILNPNFL